MEDEREQGKNISTKKRTINKDGAQLQWAIFNNAHDKKDGISYHEIILMVN